MTSKTNGYLLFLKDSKNTEVNVASEWKRHKEENDDVYKYYTNKAKSINYNIPYKEPKLTKKNPNMFMLFCKEYRSVLRQQYPEYANTQITALCAVEWKKHREANDQVYNSFKLQAEKNKPILK